MVAGYGRSQCLHTDSGGAHRRRVVFARRGRAAPFPSSDHGAPTLAPTTSSATAAGFPRANAARVLRQRFLYSAPGLLRLTPSAETNSAGHRSCATANGIVGKIQPGDRALTGQRHSEAFDLLAGAFAMAPPDGAEVEALWALFTAADVPGFQPRDGERDADAALVQGNIMRKTVHAVVRHNLQQMERRVEQNQQRVEQNQQRIERRIERIEALLEKLVSQG